MRIAILGTRGIPACYGGFETFAEELSTRLAERGHQVTVYSRAPHNQSHYRGVRVRYLPPVRHKYFETLAHTLRSTIDLWRNPQDVVLYCNGANAIFTIMARMAGIPAALNVDGLERKRKKWNALARGWYLLSEMLSTVCPSEIVTDAEEIQRYYLERYGARSTFISYGAPVGKVPAGRVLRSLNLEPQRYLLYVTRFEPENNPLMVREAFERLDTQCKLALIGDAPYAAGYISRVRDTTDPRIVLPGAIYGEGYHELQSHCLAYVHATEVGGTHPALIEAMGRGAPILYLMTRENHEVAGGAGLPFHSKDELTALMRRVLDMPEAERAALGYAAQQRVIERYGWDHVTDAYETLLEKLSRTR